MSKSQNREKEVKKKPAMTLMEKRAAKKTKKVSNNILRNDKH
jgi:hypothetical protein